MSFFFKLKKYIGYQGRAKTKYYIHSPFVYQFFLNVLEGKKDAKILALKHFPSDGLSDKSSTLLYRLITYFNAERILEIGESAAMNFSFLIDRKNTILFHKAGDSSLLSLGKPGGVDVAFVNTLKPADALSAFRHIATLVHENSVVVINHINEKQDMNEAWTAIRDNPQVTLSIELFQMGICFFRKEKLAKENFVLRY